MAAVTLPEYVAFKGDNGKYLGSIWAEGHPYQQFFASDVGDGLVRFQVLPVSEGEGHGNGLVRIKSLTEGRLWRLSPGWIWADTPSEGFDTSNKDLLFRPLLVDVKTVALQCLGNDAFCKRLTADYKNDCLNASTWSLEKYALLGVEEPVLRRTVRNVVYDVHNAEIYDKQELVLATNTATNNTTQPATVELSFSYTDKKSRTWNNSVSFKTGVSATITAGVPEVASASVIVSAEISVATEWGTTEETEKTVGANYHVTVGKGETVRVDLHATQAKCNVKFSYDQEDLRTTGQTVVIRKYDGLFRGMNYADIYYKATNV